MFAVGTHLRRNLRCVLVRVQVDQCGRGLLIQIAEEGIHANALICVRSPAQPIRCGVDAVPACQMIADALAGNWDRDHRGPAP